MKPAIITQIEKITGFELHEAPVRGADKLSGLMRFKNDPDDVEKPWCKYALEGKNLIGLNLAKTGLTDQQWDDIRAAEGFDAGKLQALNVGENQLGAFHIGADYGALRFLDLSDNKELRELRLPASGLAGLDTLRLDRCGFEALTIPRGMLSLRLLYLGNGQLKQIRFLEDCPALEQLHLEKNALGSLHLPEGFSRLWYLNADDNQMEKFTLAERLPALLSLYLRNNQLTSFTGADLELMPALDSLYLYGNPLKNVLEEILGGEHDNCFTDLRNFFYSQEKSETTELRQAKMVLVGNGETGKTSIRLKLLDKKAKLPAKEERTPGLDIASYTIKNLPYAITQLPQEIDFNLQIWDFGGQGKYREVQQLFCSPRSLYLFVTSHDDLEEKDDYIGFEYWLSMVNAYSYDKTEKRPSPVIHVVNKIDEKERLIDAKELHDLFGNVAGFVKISCKALTGFDQFETTIKETLPLISNDIFTRPITVDWLSVKTALEQRRADNHISREEYLDICRKYRLEEGEANSWLRILDRIGTVIHFGENPDLKDWIVLNPNWIKEALYAVLDSRQCVGGALRPGDLLDIWDKDSAGNTYSADDREKLLSVMQAYELCYERQNAFGETEYVIPALLRDKRPPLPPALENPACRLRIKFDPFLPAGTVNKLMVRLNKWVYNNLMWKNNAVFHDAQSNVFAHIEEDWKNHVVHLSLSKTGEGDLYDVILRELADLNQKLKDTKFMHRLGFEIQAEYHGKWVDTEIWEQLCRTRLSGAPGKDTGRAGRAEDEPPARDRRPITPSGIEPPWPPAERPIRILYVAANPSDQERIETDVEYRKLKAQLQRGRARDEFKWLDALFAATIDELIRAKNDNPHLLHFAGHGVHEGLVLATENNKSQPIPDAALERLFKPLSGITGIVVLNACYSALQARLISSFGIWVVGHNLPIKDPAAIAFSEGFYNGLGEGKNFEAAFNDAMTVIETKYPAAASIIEVWKDGQQIQL